MSNEWVDTNLGAICEKVVTGGTPLTSKPEFYENGKIPWLKTKEVNFCRIYGTENFISEQGLNNSSAKLIPVNSVIIAMYGQGDTAGRVAVNKVPLATNQACCNLIFNPELADYNFVYYFLKRSYKELVRRKTGSAQPNLNTKILKEFEIKLPALREQKRIAHILGTLDDKIELNRKMNETLEAMAQALFKSWFVDFDPVIDNALAAGNEIPEQFKKRARSRSVQAKKGKFNHLFPSSFTFNETLNKWIPEGWEVTNLKECLDTISKTYNLKEKEEIIFLNTGDIEEGKFLHNDLSAVKGLPGQAKKSIQKGDILYSEIRPKNKRFAFVYFDSSEYVVSTKLMVLRPKNEIDSLFYYQILKSESTITELQFLAESRSGTFPQITFDTLSAIEFSLPNESKIIEEYVKQLKEIFNKSIQNIESVESLTKTRDTLLPKLISGKIKTN